jgi:hypothetical protein
MPPILPLTFEGIFIPYSEEDTVNRIKALEVDDLDVEELDSEGLPELVDVGAYMTKLPKLPPELIQGVVREGHKMMISGASKSGKSFYSCS